VHHIVRIISSLVFGPTPELSRLPEASKLSWMFSLAISGLQQQTTSPHTHTHSHTRTLAHSHTRALGENENLGRTWHYSDESCCGQQRNHESFTQMACVFGLVFVCDNYYHHLVVMEGLIA